MQTHGELVPETMNEAQEAEEYTLATRMKERQSMLKDLIDLEIKEANAFEARNTCVSGNTITVFTAVTISLLSASFMTTLLLVSISKFLSINNDEMEFAYALESTGTETLESPSFQLDAYLRHFTMVTAVAVAVLFIAFALCVNPHNFRDCEAEA
ncbi:hypothetical protein Landi51_11575 [Colletotrichum acutatum]